MVVLGTSAREAPAPAGASVARRRVEPRRAPRAGPSQVDTVLHLQERGMSRKDIAEKTGISPSVVRRAANLAADDEWSARKKDLAEASATLRDAISDEAALVMRRRQAARATGHTAPLECQGPRPVLRAAPVDPRPIAAGRDPCPRCGTRGDLGCRHQAPFEAGAIE